MWLVFCWLAVVLPRAARGGYVDEAALAEQAESCLLGPEMGQLFSEPVVGTCEPALSVLKDVSLLLGQRDCPFQTLFLPLLVFLRRGQEQKLRIAALKQYRRLGVCRIRQTWSCG